MVMRILSEYVFFINQLLEKPRNELSIKVLNKKDDNIEKIIHDYDVAILDSYKYIEKVIEEEKDR